MKSNAIIVIHKIVLTETARLESLYENPIAGIRRAAKDSDVVICDIQLRPHSLDAINAVAHPNSKEMTIDSNKLTLSYFIIGVFIIGWAEVLSTLLQEGNLKINPDKT